MGAQRPADIGALFERCFREGDVDGLASLYEEDALLPTREAVATGHDEIRAALQGYIDLDGDLVLGEPLVFTAGDLALIHTPWTRHRHDGSTSEGVSAEIARRQPDGTWKYVVDSPYGSDLLSDS